MTILCAGMGEQATANLIRNGSLLNNANAWFPVVLADGVTYQAGQGRTGGGGALAIAANARADYRPRGMVLPLGSLTTYDLIAHVKTDDLPADASFNLAFLSDEFGTEVVYEDGAFGEIAVEDTWQEISLLAASVPVGATHVRIQLLSTSAGVMLGSDIYFGPTGQSGAPYPPAAVLGFPANRILNGSFDSHILGWAGWYGDETIERDTSTSITGAGSLTITTPGGGAEQGAFYGWPDYSHNLIIDPGEVLRLSFRARGSGTIKATMSYNGAAPADVWSGTLTGTAQLVEVDVTVPALAWSVLPLIATTTDQATTFTIDDVSLGSAP